MKQGIKSKLSFPTIPPRMTSNRRSLFPRTINAPNKKDKKTHVSKQTRLNSLARQYINDVLSLFAEQQQDEQRRSRLLIN